MTPITFCPFCDQEEDYILDSGFNPSVILPHTFDGDAGYIRLQGKCGHQWLVVFGFKNGIGEACVCCDKAVLLKADEAIIKLAEKYKYDTARRYENVAGYQPLTEKQRHYILKMSEENQKAFEAFTEITNMLIGLWGDTGARKSDGMFIIPILQGLT